MKPEKFLEAALVTLSNDYEKISARLKDPDTIELLHAAMGMVTEAGEMLDMLKKHIFYGKDLDLVNLEEELGDSNWYQSIAIHSARMKGHATSWEQIWEKNIAKLQARYGDKFDETKAEGRDLKREREILEGPKRDQQYVVQGMITRMYVSREGDEPMTEDISKALTFSMEKRPEEIHGEGLNEAGTGYGSGSGLCSGPLYKIVQL